MIDLTKITMPFGTLRRKIRKALIAHDGPYEWLSAGNWILLSCAIEDVHSSQTVRAKPIEVDEPANGQWFDAIAPLAKIEAGKPITSSQVSHIFAAVKEWQEANAAWEIPCAGPHGEIASRRRASAVQALMAVQVPS